LGCLADTDLPAVPTGAPARDGEPLRRRRRRTVRRLRALFQGARHRARAGLDTAGPAASRRALAVAPAGFLRIAAGRRQPLRAGADAPEAAALEDRGTRRHARGRPAGATLSPAD